MVEPMAHRPHTTTEAERFLHCAKCNAVAARAETLGRAVVYVRCAACGETWTIAERRKMSRQNSRAARFPAAGA
jgi:phage FluMu protein Com